MSRFVFDDILVDPRRQASGGRTAIPHGARRNGSSPPAAPGPRDRLELFRRSLGEWRLAHQQAPILTYHRLTDRTGTHPCSIRVARFRGHLALLRRLGYRAVSPVVLADALRRGAPVPARTVAITFDDGYVDTLAVALPLLQEFGFTATCYVVVGAVGQSSRWADPAPLMDWEGIRAWLGAGMDIGSHSMSHPDLTTLTDFGLRAEVTRSRVWLEDRLGVAVRSFAYPFNRLNRRALDAVAEAGYTAGCAGAELHRSPHALSRMDVAHESWLWFSLQLWRAYPALRGAYRAAFPRSAPAA